MTPEETWNAFGRQASPALERFEWTQYTGMGHGPGLEILCVGPGAVVLDLGVGKGLLAEHVLAAGSAVVGVDLSPVQLQWARDRLGHSAELHQAEVLEFLAGRGDAEFDSVYSRFGAHWFVNPRKLFPEVLRVLKPGGVFAFSHREPSCDCVGAGDHHIRDSQGGTNKVVRWDFPLESWKALLAEYDFCDTSVELWPGPAEGQEGTIIGLGQKRERTWRPRVSHFV